MWYIIYNTHLYIYDTLFTMPLKLCRTFINMGNKINSVKTVTGLLKCKCNLEIVQISGL